MTDITKNRRLLIYTQETYEAQTIFYVAISKAPDLEIFVFT